MTNLRLLVVLTGAGALFASVGACASGSEATDDPGATTGGAAGAGGGAAGSAGAKAGASGASAGGAAGGTMAGASGASGSAGVAGTAGASSCGTEICDNGADDDCDGLVDEGCSCVPGAVAACFGADPSHRGKGACKDGIMHCTSTGEFGTWLACEGDVLPVAELCDPAGLDENCDGTANENCECKAGSAPAPCGSSVGECKQGTQECLGGKLGKCVGSVEPTPELCDGLDNDCDGKIDEDLSRPCGESKGICTLGLQHCSDAKWGACEGATLPAEEICNGLDDDCDGMTDEEVVATCGTATGACMIGQQFCKDGVLGPCVGAVGPVAETCNGIDDDCDGKVDQGLDVVCGSTEGTCKAGVSKCVGGAYGACTGNVGPAAEICDGLDNDCDGTVDQGCGCVVGSAPVACGSDVGTCKKGLQACVGGKLGPCVGGLGPVAEMCNGLDDDCNGQIDDGVVESCGSSQGACKQGTRVCTNGAFGACTGDVGPVAETCNGVDDDCDGQVDEGLAMACGSDVGRCAAGLQSCVAGAWSACVGAVGPIAEVCDGAIDEDCDGVVDNGCGCTAGATIACGSKVGACKQGTQTCDAKGAWGACVGATAPAAETCNGIDDNCNGVVDEGCSCITGEVLLCGSKIGQCSYGLQTCTATGTWGPCVGNVGPSAELCNGLDDDCDGMTDEGCGCIAGQTQACGSTIGQCKAGKATCTLQGVFGPCSGAVVAATEVCNSLDDDCDGMTDEGGVCPSPPPVVTCPGGATTVAGTGVPLVAQASNAGGGALVTSWSVTARPSGSVAQPTPASAATTQFTPDLPGTYELTFCATNAQNVSSCCKTAVTATSACAPPPTTPAVTTCGTSWDRRPIVTFAALPAGVVYEVWQPGASSPLAVVSTTGQNYFRPPTPIGAGGPPPGADASLYVKACKVDNPTCCSTSNTVTTKLVEACSTVAPASAANVVISEYLINGSGSASPGPTFQAGEAIEITNLSHCPVSLAGTHFGYQNNGGGAFRWMNFSAADVIPPRGVYVAIRAQNATSCVLPFLGPDDPSLFGLKTSALDMQGDNLTSGWFNNSGGGTSTLRVATGAWVDITSGTTISLIKPYASSNAACKSVGFNAVDACGDVVAGGQPTDVLDPNQLGRLWHPCDRVVNPFPASCHLVGHFSPRGSFTMRRFPLSALLALGVGLCSSVSLAAPSTTLVISEFRVRGSVGGNDEFVEIYNLSNAPINAGGYMLWGSSSGGVTQLRATIPANTTIPSKGFYLFYNSTASTGYSGVTPGNTGYSLGISDDGGLALLAPGNVVVDAVGLSAGSAYKEGTTLTHWTSNQDSSFRRKSANCTPDVDTDNNANDFTKITPSTPQNLGSCCVDAHCASPPAGQCYPATGSCNATAGTCSYPIQTGATCNDADACTDSDVCLAGGACQGTNKACDTPPVPTCANATTQRTFASTGTCAGGACSYSSTDTACVTTCNAMTGLCADPCAGVTCNTPPNTQCYAAAGTCNMSSGSCDYTKSGVGTSCTDSDPCTVSDACDASGQCTGVPKTCTPPVAECIGQSSRTYSGGACTPGTGACTFSQSDVSCQFGCDGTSGTCKPNPCVGVSCVTPPGNCYQTDGLCNTSNGQCVYSPKVSNTPCDDGAACTTSDVCDGAGTCGGAAKVCTPPAPTCASATVSRSFSGGVCVLATGACTFQQADTPCASGCNAGTGLCNNDPCAGVVCDKPTSSCQQATGTCSGGVCTYPLKPDNAQCDDGDPCTGPDRCNALGACSGATQICNTPPAATCSTPTTSLVYAPVGTCGAGTCTYASSPTPCAFGCDAGTGLCVGDPCTDVQCTTPPSGCHVSLGTCNSGTCSYSLKQPGSSCSDGDACTTSDACDVVGACKGVPKSCNAPPAAVCVDAKTSRTAEAVGTCKAADGSCDYKTTDTVCATACDAGTGLCSGDPCATVKCDQPPSACHAATGTCAGGQCTYTPLQAGAACNDGNPCTTGDACTAGVCAGTAKVCNTPPPAECTGAKTSQTYAAVGTCSPVDGVCGYDVTTATCATSCDLKTGLCVNDPCTGMVCNKPTSPCQVATGECKAGACTYPSKPLGAACDDGNACTNQDTCDAAGMCKGMQIASCGAGGAGGGAGASGAGGAAGGTGGGGSTAAGNAGNGGAAGNATGGASAGGFGGTTSSGGSGNNPATAGKAGSVGAGSAGAPAGIDETDVATDSPGCGCATPGESLSGREWAFGLGALGLAWSISRRRRRA